MTIKIEEAKKEGYKNQLKMSTLMPFEYAIMSKNYAEPLTGVANIGDDKKLNWFLYEMHVEEFKTQNPETGEPYTSKPDEAVSYFANSEKVHEKLKDVPVNTRFKMYVVKKEGKTGQYSEYMVEMLDDVKEDVSSENSAPDQTLSQRLKSLKDNGVDKETAVATLSKEFDMSPDVIGGKYDAL